MDENNTKQFTITRTFETTLEKLWRAWTQDAELAQWLFPFGVSSESVSFDVRVGGRYRYTMVNDETGETFPTGGEFLEVTPRERLKFTWGDPEATVEGSPVITLRFLPQGDRTEMEFHLQGYAGEPGDGFVYDGWDEALTNLKRHLAGEEFSGQ